MAVKKVGHGDRVRRADSDSPKATATVIDVHSGSKSKSTTNVLSYTVLPDDRPRSKGSVTWEVHETVRVAGPSLACSICTSRDHHTFYCPKGA